MAKVANPQYEKLAGRMREFRRHLGKSQAEFGKLIGLDQTAVSAIEAGVNDVTIRTLYNLTDLDCNPNWLLLGVGPISYASLDRPVASVEMRERPGHTEYLIRVTK